MNLTIAVTGYELILGAVAVGFGLKIGSFLAEVVWNFPTIPIWSSKNGWFKRGTS